MRKRALILLAAGTMSVLLLVGLANLPIVRSLVLSRLADALRTSAGLDLAASSLDIDLFTLSATLSNPRVSAIAHTNDPILTADSATVDLNWRALGGRLAVDRLVLRSPRLAIRQPGNLPSGGGGAMPDALPLFPVHVNDLDLEIVTPSASVAVLGADIDLAGDATTLAGTLRAPRGVRVAAGPVRFTASAAAASLAFDGRTVALRDFTADGADTTLRASGTVGVAGESPAVDLDISGSLGLAAISWSDDELRPRGTVAGRVQVVGPLSGPAVAADISSDSVIWAPWEVRGARAAVALRDRVLTVTALHASMAGGTIDGEATVTLDQRPGEASRASARWTGVDLAKLDAIWGERRPSNAIASSGHATWAWTAPALPATAAPARIDVATRLAAGTESIEVRAEATGADRVWHVSLEDVNDQSPLRADAEVVVSAGAWVDSTVAGTVAWRVPDARREAERLRAFGVPIGEGDLSTMRGGLTADATLGGTLGQPRVTGTIAGHALELAGLAAFDADAVFTLTGADLTASLRSARAPVPLAGDARISVEGRLEWPHASVTRFVVAPRSGGQLEGSGRLDLTSLRGDVQLAGGDLALAIPASSAGAAVEVVGATVNAALTGGPRDLHGTLAFTGSIESSDGTPEIGAAEVRAEFAGDRAIVTANLSAVPAAVRAEVALSAPYRVSGTGVFGATDLAALFDRVGASSMALRGEASGSMEFSGDVAHWRNATAAITVAPMNLRLDDVPVRVPGGARVTVSEGRVRLARVEGSLGDVAIAVDAEIPIDGVEGRASISMEGGLAGLAPWIERLAPDMKLTADGRLTGQLSVGRAAAGVDVTGEVTLALDRIARGTEVVAENVVVDVAFDRGLARGRRLSGTTYSGVIDARATAPLDWLNPWLPDRLKLAPPDGDDRGDFDGTARFDVGALLQAMAVETEQQMAGAVVVAAHLSSARPAIDAATGRITLERGEITTLGQTVRQVTPTVLTLANRRFTVEALQWEGPNTRIAGRGFFGVADQPTEVDLTIDTALELFQAIVPGRTAGQVQARARVTREAGAWAIAGEAAVTQGRWLIPEWRLLLSDWSGRVAVAGDTVTVPGLEGRLNGGIVKVDGRMSLSGGASPDRLRLVAQDVLLNLPEGLHSQVDGDLEWRARDRDNVLTGAVRVTTGEYREPVTSMLEMIDALAPDPGAAPPAAEGLLARTALDVAMETTDPVIVDNSLGSVELVPHLRLVGTLAAPALDGPIDVLDDGRIRLGGRSYRLRESSLRFAPATGMMPTLDLIGDTRVGEYDVTLRLRGSAARIESTFTSSPPLGERDLRSLLVTGRAETGQTQGDEDFGLQAVSDDILGFAGKFVGLDSVRLGSADLDLVAQDASSAQHLTVSKSLGRYFEVVLSENLEYGQLTWMVVVKPRPGYSARVASVENQRAVLEFRHELAFGPGKMRAVARPSGAAAAAIRPVVAQVTIAGTPGFGDATLLERLRLKAGDRFDVRRWIDDRLRLQAFYRAEGYHQVRIVPTRTADPGREDRAEVRLQYEITRGPRSTIETTGVRLPASVTERMYAAWGAMPVPDLLQEELTDIVRRHLAAAGHLRPDITVRVEPPTDQLAVVRVGVSSNERSATYRVRWDGARAMTPEALDEVVRPALVNAGALLDAPGIIDRVRAAYAARGYLGVELAAGDLDLHDGVAELPIRITEGSQARVASTTLTGVDPSRLGPAGAALALAPGDVVAPASVADAVGRLTGWYDEQGFRDAVVSSAVTRAPDGAAAIAITVVEGPRYVVDVVEVVGRESTAESLVRQAVTVAPDGPASQSRAGATERNLYDIGSFRQVAVTFEPKPAPGAGAVVPVVAAVTLQENRRYQFKYGVQVSSDYSTKARLRAYSWGATAELRDRNFLGRAMQASLVGRYESGQKLAAIQFAAPRTFGRAIRTNLYTRWRIESTNFPLLVLTDDRRELSVEQRWRPRRALELSWGYGFSRRTFGLNDRPTGQKLLEFAGVLAGPTMSIIIDYRDDPFDPTTGWYHTSNVEFGLRPLGSDLGYNRYLMRVSRYLTVGRVTFAAAGRLGVLAGYSGTAPLSVLDLLFTTGGANSVRGYPEGALSAITEDKLYWGGTRLLGMNGEVRYPIFRFIGGAAFVDAGNTFITFHDLSSRGLGVGAGLGLRIDTPLAPVRLDFGYPLTPSFGYRGLRFHFAIGQIF